MQVSRSAVFDIATERTHKNVPWPEGGPPRKRAGGQRKPIGEYDPTDTRVLELEADIAHLTEERMRTSPRSETPVSTVRSFRCDARISRKTRTDP